MNRVRGIFEPYDVNRIIVWEDGSETVLDTLDQRTYCILAIKEFCNALALVFDPRANDIDYLPVVHVPPRAQYPSV